MAKLFLALSVGCLYSALDPEATMNIGYVPHDKMQVIILTSCMLDYAIISLCGYVSLQSKR